MRPNYAQDAPPTSIEVGGFSYICETDYRVWLDVLRLMKEIRLDDESEEGLEKASEQILELEVMVFGGWLKEENPLEVLQAITEFSKGYPSAPVNAKEQSEPTFSYEYDLNDIIIAIRNQSGIDLSYRRTEPFHWWEFLLEFHNLCGDHHILNLMEIRGYKGDNKELKRLKQEYALPTEYTAAELAEYEAWSALFDTPEGGEPKHED